MPQVTAPTQIWDKVKAELSELLPRDIFDSWFSKVTCVKAEDSSVVLQVQNEFSAIWINDNYLDLLTKAFQRFLGYPVSVTLENGAASADSEETAQNNRVETIVETESSPRADDRKAKKSVNPSSANLNRRNTFENFVIGSNSQLAHAAAIAVAHAPAGAYNPLFVYGETGLGKTHLMHAVGHHILLNKPNARIAYLSSEKFTNEFISAIQENTLTQFRKRYRRVDVLLIDDVQFLSGKERIQEEFFHTFNELFEAQKQIFLSSDRPANEIAKLESRLVSRFQWGLVTDIQAPDFETRVAILRKKAEQHNFKVSDEIINFIAEHIVKNIRRLEGALIKVCSYSSLTGNPLNISTCEMLLRDVLMEAAKQQLTIDTIQKKVADYFELRHSDMLSRRRPNHIAVPRQIAMYLSRDLTKHSLQEIGEAFGGRDHGTVIHACRQVENLTEQDDTVRHSVDYLRTQLSR
ncbi:MAG: chromosomal replication initiator protein DnaA [Opitutales bacterium]|jgi:chromosomal replication initiator protein|nr:chromosomal replication initiator protein DnaA [Opitutales bacterium]MBT5168624.1 chromosomal replication initiator protein DnaA [Opitutales bacterium]MBT5814938.1 chromosomal replication initiator protein DnaA [Opitutales bacterium]MBT6769508.1 chromosomal replication initiator protein DnaA [Opitutales bacterium]MDG2254881.1 chromosomal replication initiator protein DnaA [Opitutaceae bacterium]